MMRYETYDAPRQPLPPPAVGQADLFKRPSIVGIANSNAAKLSPEFLEWLPTNLHVWDAFVEQALLVVRRGFKHYSARTIVHVLRHHSAVSESGVVYKINNNVSPYLARLFDIIYPQHAGLWEYRSTGGED